MTTLILPPRTATQADTPAVRLRPTQDTLAAVPTELTALPRWLLWRPTASASGSLQAISPITLQPTGPQPERWHEWATFQRALDTYLNPPPSRPPFAGLLFVVTDRDPYCSVRYHPCIDLDGFLEPYAEYKAAVLRSYAELTPDAAGIQILCRASLPQHHPPYQAGPITLHDRHHLIPITGYHLPIAPTSIEASQNAVRDIHYALLPPAQPVAQSIAPTHPHTNLEWALAYAYAGIAVIPATKVLPDGTCSCRQPGCDSPGKHPALKDWQCRATTDARQITRWWRADPQANVAAPTGRAFDIFDVDMEDLDAWTAITAITLPPTWHAQTGSRHHHFAFQPNPSLTNRVKKLPFADLRVHRGVAILPPSRNANGFYTWLTTPWDTPLAPWPADILERVRPEPRPQAPARRHQPVPGTPPVPRPLERYAAAGAVHGERNAKCFWLACRLREHGVPDYDALDTLRTFARACQPPMDPDELLRTWHSSQAYQQPDLALVP